MTADSQLDQVLLGAIVIAVAISTALLLTHRRWSYPSSYLSGVEADTAHLVMNAAMAWMLTPWSGPGARPVFMGAFAAMSVVFAALLVVGTLRDTGYWRAQRPVSGYHLLAATAMTYATAVMPDMSAGKAGSDMSAMPGMGGPREMHDMSGMGTPSALALALAVIFALDALGTAVVVLFAPGAVRTGAGRSEARAGQSSKAARADEHASTSETARLLRMSAYPHVVMDLGMIAMLAGR